MLPCGTVQELGASFNVGEIPADLRAEADEWHEKLVEKAIEVDDAAMEAFFEGEVSLPILKAHHIIRSLMHFAPVHGSLECRVCTYFCTH